MSIAFLDFEASSLSHASYPIEVGWVLEDGTGSSLLIRPEPHWTDWSSEAEGVHGIRRETLLADGIPAPDAARRLAQVLGGVDLYSDAEAQDQWWLSRLLATAGMPTLPVHDVHGAFAGAVRPLVSRMPTSIVGSLAQSFFRQAEVEAERMVPVRHRAQEDAKRLWWIWRRLKELSAAALDGWPG